MQEVGEAERIERLAQLFVEYGVDLHRAVARFVVPHLASSRSCAENSASVSHTVVVTSPSQKLTMVRVAGAHHPPYQGASCLVSIWAKPLAYEHAPQSKL